MKFAWDAEKAAANLKTHGVSFEEAASAFADRQSVTVPDPDRGNLLVVCHTDRGENTRIISAWRANLRQRKQYEEGS